jgi:hypothetical protein
MCCRATVHLQRTVPRTPCRDRARQILARSQYLIILRIFLGFLEAAAVRQSQPALLLPGSRVRRDAFSRCDANLGEERAADQDGERR